MSMGERVNLVAGPPPETYHCSCEFCRRSLGELRPEGGGYYSRLERREYYDKSESGEGGHIAKSPLHMARWLIQKFTEPGDWVVDPTIGAGTTAVEAITQGRNVAGMEIQYVDVLKSNVVSALSCLIPGGRIERGTWTETVDVQKMVAGELVFNEDKSPVMVKKKIRHYEPVDDFRKKVLSKLNGTAVPRGEVRRGDARRIGSLLDDLGIECSLVFNNPPYSGDESPKADKSLSNSDRKFRYEDDLPNLAFLKESQEYYDTVASIYSACIAKLKPGGHFAYGIKDMVRERKPVMLHQRFNELLAGRLKMEHVGTAFLMHHPRTFHLNRYYRTYGAHPPYFQTIGVFRKPSFWKPE